MDNDKKSSNRRPKPKRSFEKPKRFEMSENSAYILKTSWEEYCNATAIHGIKYFVEKGRPKLERSFWMLAILACLIGSSFLIIKVYEKWQTSPVIVSFAETETGIWEIPFPAITICPQTKSRKAIFDFTSLYHRIINSSATPLTDEERIEFEYASLICGDHLTDEIVYNHTRLRFINETVLTVLDFLRKIAPPQQVVLNACRWFSAYYNSCVYDQEKNYSLFRPVLTDYGLCYTFNMLSNKEIFTKEATAYYEEDGEMPSEGWTLEHGYPENVGVKTYPWRARFGDFNSLLANLRAEAEDFDYLCAGSAQGFMVFLHSPMNLPVLAMKYFQVGINQEVKAAIKPSVLTTSEGLRSYDPMRRHCYFPSERKLRFFKEYTQENCKLECMTNMSMSICECTAVYLPRSSDMPICKVKKQEECIINATTKMEKGDFHFHHKSSSSHKTCNCMPSCISLEYDFEASQAVNEWRKVSIARGTGPDKEFPNGTSLSLTYLFFDDYQFIPRKRSELYGPAEFLGNCGGLLSLFSGFSIISLIEIMYHLTIRLMYNVRHLKRHKADTNEEDGRHRL